jgi:hypothetical protein
LNVSSIRPHLVEFSSLLIGSPLNWHIAGPPCFLSLEGGDLAEQRELAFVLQARSWSGADFHKAANVCAECGEPADLSESGKCQWCDIAEVDKEEASRHSLLSLTLAHGIDEGIALAFDRMEPRGRLTAEWRRPLEYKCGEEIKPGDRVLFHGNPAEVELVSCNPYDSNPARCVAREEVWQRSVRRR